VGTVHLIRYSTPKNNHGQSTGGKGKEAQHLRSYSLGRGMVLTKVPEGLRALVHTEGPELENNAEPTRWREEGQMKPVSVKARYRRVLTVSRPRESRGDKQDRRRTKGLK